MSVTLPAGARQLVDLGGGMLVVSVELETLREQDLNARVMSTEQFESLVNNIKRRGQLESMPYCHLKDGQIWIVSGHHRVRAASSAGLKEAAIMLETQELTRSAETAKQIAHNAIAGRDDEDVLRALLANIVTAEDMLETGLGQDMFDVPSVDMDFHIAPSLGLDFRQVILAFLPHELEDLTKLVDLLSRSDLLAVAERDQFDGFVEALSRYQEFADVRRVSTAVALLTRTALAEIERLEAEKQANEGENDRSGDDNPGSSDD